MLLFVPKNTRKTTRIYLYDQKLVSSDFFLYIYYFYSFNLTYIKYKYEWEVIGTVPKNNLCLGTFECIKLP
jgi:hypothetical protein